MNFSTPLLVSVFLMGFAQASTAASVLFYYTVEVDEAHGFEPGSLQVGDIVGGSFSYDLNQVDVAPVSDTGEYIISNAEAQMDLYAGGRHFQNDSSVRAFVSSNNRSSLDVFSMNTYFSTGGVFNIILMQALEVDGVPPDYFKNDLLPAALSLSALSDASIELSVPDYYVHGSVVSLIQAPEPSMASCFVFGFSALILRRQRCGYLKRV